MMNCARPARPSLRRTAAEFVALLLPSTLPEFESTAPQDPAHGDGYAGLGLPAIFRGDGNTLDVRGLLAGLGYAAYGWNLGINVGPTARLISGVAQCLARLSIEHGAVSVVGYSMGGLFARLLAVRYPSRVRQVITVCSPINQPARSVWIPLDPFLGFWQGVDLHALSAEIAAPLRVPSTCVYSRDDGIVSWAGLRDPEGAGVNNVEVSGCHVAMGHNPETLRVLANCLAR